MSSISVIRRPRAKSRTTALLTLCVALCVALCLTVGCDADSVGQGAAKEQGPDDREGAGSDGGALNQPSGGAMAGGDEGGASIGGGVTAGGGGAVYTEWGTREVFEGLSPTCSPCHSEGQSLPAFESLASFERLIVSNPAWISPGEPERSELLSLLTGAGSGVYAQMPPSGLSYTERVTDLSAQRPPAPSADNLSAWIEGLSPGALITTPEEEACAELPVQTTLSRLSRGDYQRAIEDLLGTQRSIAPDLPADNESYHFTHLAELLTLSPLLIEKYELAAQALSEEAIPERYPAPLELLFEGERDMSSAVGAASSTFWNLWAQGDLLTSAELTRTGRYELQLSVGGGQAGPDPVRFALIVDDVEVAYGETWAVSPNFERLTFQVPLEAGSRSVGVRFLNDYYCIEEGLLAGRCSELGDRNLHFDSLLISGPLYEELPLSPFEERYLRCPLHELREDQLRPEALERCGRETVHDFLRLAWRGQLSAEDLDRAWALVEAELMGASGPMALRFSKGLRTLVHAALLSPRFLLKEEATRPGAPLSGRELAVRLAALIWRSVPDAELLNEAEVGALSTEEGLNSSVQRMLSDPRALRLAEEFGGRWLTLHHLEGSAPDYQAFPSFDEELRAAMSQETLLVLQTIFEEGRSILDLIDADFTWLSPRLAAHYELTDAVSPTLEQGTFQRVALPQAGRLGALTHGAWLTATSHPTRTSPVVRGKWVLENLLCMPPPPPPPGVEGLPPEVNQDASVRARLEQHRADPACAACHTHMDAIGFGFEQLDGVGVFRLSDAGRVIEPMGALPPYVRAGLEEADGVTFEDAPSLVRALRADPRVSSCVAERFIVYALGRGLRPDERCLFEPVITQASAEGMTFSALVRSVALSPLFRTRGERRP